MRYQKTGEGKVWDFVGIAQDSDDPAKRFVILRPDRGDDISIAIDRFQSEYKLLSRTNSSSSEAIKETLSNIRQISTIRFVALPFFLGASAAMANAFVSSSGSWYMEPMLAVFGLGLSLAGVTFEVVLSRNLLCWWKALRKEIGTLPWSMIYAHRSDAAVWAARIALFAPYLAMVFYWTQQVGCSERWAMGLSGAILVGSVLVWAFARPSQS